MKILRGRQLTILLAAASIVAISAIVALGIHKIAPNSRANQSLQSTRSAARHGSTAKGDFVAASQAGNYLGRLKTVRVNISYTYADAAGTEFLDQYENYASGFVVTIFSSNLDNFNSDPASTYLGDTIDVTGVVSSYDGYFEILNPTTIRIVG